MIDILGLKIFDTDDITDYTNYIPLGNSTYRVIDKPLHWSLDFLYHPDMPQNVRFLVKSVDVMFYDLAAGQVSFIFTLHPNTISDSGIYSMSMTIHSLLSQNGLKGAVLVENKGYYANELIHIRSKDL